MKPLKPHRFDASAVCRSLLLAALLGLPAGTANALLRVDLNGLSPDAPPLDVRPPAQEPQPVPTPKDFGELRPGETKRQELESGESHAFRVSLAQGQYLRAIVTQDGIDVAVYFFEPGAQQAAAYVDSPNGFYGPESVSLVGRVAGEFRLEVRSEDRGSMPGRYELRLDGPREPTEADLRRIKAEAAYMEGRRLRRLSTNEARTQAIEKHKEALGLWQLLGDRYGEACTLYAIGQTYRALPNLAQARDYMNQALLIFQELNDLPAQALLNNDIGAAIRDLDSPQAALPFYQRAYDLYDRAGSQWGKAHMHNNIGNAYARLGDFQQALARFEQSLPMWQALRDRNMEANAYNSIGGALESLGNPTQALVKYRQALGIWQEMGKADRLAIAYNNVAIIHHGFGDTQVAVDNYDRALAQHRKQKNPRGEANVLDNLGMTHADLGDVERALEYFNQALLIRQQLKEPQGLGITLDNVGYANYLLGRYDEALNHYQQAQQFFERANDNRGQAYTLTHVGMVYAARGDVQKSLDTYEQALKIQRQRGSKLWQAVTLDKIGTAHGALGDGEKSAAAFQEALTLWTELGDEQGRARSLYGLARVESGRDNLVGARDKIEQAIKIVESLRGRTANQQLRTTLLATRHNYYQLDVDLKMRLHERAPSANLVEAAFEASERGRARGLIDLLAEGRTDIRRWVTPELLAEKEELERRLGALSDRLLLLRGSRVEPKDAAKVSEKVEALKQEVDALSNRHDDVLARIRSQSPRYAQLTQPELPKAGRLKELLDPDTLLLEYNLGEERSYLWAVTRAGVEGFRLGRAAEIQKAADELKAILLAYESRPEGESSIQYVARLSQSAKQYQQRASELSRLILGPVADRLGVKRLVVVADGALQFIPFETLPVPDVAQTRSARSAVRGKESLRPLGLSKEVVYLPSASTLALLRSRPRAPAAKTVAVFADPVFDSSDDRVLSANGKTSPATPAPPRPDGLGRALRDVNLAADSGRLERLRYTLDEANEIVAVAPPGSAMKVVSFGATRAAVTGTPVSGYRFVHFATHALLNDKRPQLSGLVLSLVDERGEAQDGFLRLGDVYNLDLPVDLVVLSACRTGIGKEVRGEGLIGLTRGFMYAGAGAVVASLWNVDDEATAALMKSFYRHMLQDGQTPAAALRLAKTDVMQARTEWRAPYFWAGFVLHGDWRGSQDGRKNPEHRASFGTY